MPFDAPVLDVSTASRVAELLTNKTRERFSTRQEPCRTRGKWPRLRHGRADRLYRWSLWGAEHLLERLSGDSSDQHLVQVGLRVATTALRRCGAFCRASDAAPTQPRFCDVADLVLVFGAEMHGAVVCPVTRQAELLADRCHERDLVVLLWNGQCSSLSHPRFAFRILMSGAAKMVREGDERGVQRILSGSDFMPLLWSAVGNTHADLLRALEDDRTGSFGNGQRIMRRKAM